MSQFTTLTLDTTPARSASVMLQDICAVLDSSLPDRCSIVLKNRYTLPVSLSRETMTRLIEEYWTVKDRVIPRPPR